MFANSHRRPSQKPVMEEAYSRKAGLSIHRRLHSSEGR